MINQLKQQITNKKDREYYIQCFENGVDINHILAFNKLYKKNINLFENEKLKPSDYIGKYNNMIESFQELNNKANKLIIKSSANKKMRSFFSNKYKHLTNEETLSLFCDLSEIKPSEEFYNGFRKKLAAFRDVNHLNETLSNEIITMRNWDYKNQIHNIQRENKTNNNNQILFEIHNFEDAKDFGTQMWCISRDEETFKSYTKKGERIFFKYNFNEFVNSVGSMQAFVVEPDGSIKDGYKKDDSIMTKEEIKNENIIFDKLTYDEFLENIIHLSRTEQALSFYKSKFSSEFKDNNDSFQLDLGELRFFLIKNGDPDFCASLLNDIDYLFDNNKDKNSFVEILYSHIECSFLSSYNELLEELLWSPAFHKTELFKNLNLEEFCESMYIAKEENAHNFLLVKNQDVDTELYRYIKKNKEYKATGLLNKIFESEKIDLYKLFKNEDSLLTEILIKNSNKIEKLFNLEENSNEVFKILKENKNNISSYDMGNNNEIAKKHNVSKEYLISEEDSSLILKEEILKKPTHIFVKKNKIEKHDIRFNYEETMSMFKKVFLDEDIPFEEYEDDYVFNDFISVKINSYTSEFLIKKDRVDQEAKKDFFDFVESKSNYAKNEDIQKYNNLFDKNLKTKKQKSNLKI